MPRVCIGIPPNMRRSASHMLQDTAPSVGVRCVCVCNNRTKRVQQRTRRDYVVAVLSHTQTRRRACSTCAISEAITNIDRVRLLSIKHHTHTHTLRRAAGDDDDGGRSGERIVAPQAGGDRRLIDRTREPRAARARDHRVCVHVMCRGRRRCGYKSINRNLY